MKSICEKSPIFIGGVLISHVGNDVPEEVKKDIQNLIDLYQEVEQ